MNKYLFLLSVRSLKRRALSILRTSVAIFISFAFVAGMLLFQDNMYQWQQAVAKKHFGDWFVMNTSYNEKNGIESHPYLNNMATAKVTNLVYNEAGSTDVKLGYMSKEFIKLGNITLDKGSFPVNDDEIAVDWNTLLELNQSYEIGDEIKITTYKGSSYDEKNKLDKTYKLTGIIKSYTNIWQGGNSLPGIIITQNEAESMAYDTKIIAIYQLKSFIKNEDFNKIYENMKETTNTKFIYNSSVYDYQPWGNKLIYDYMFILVMIIGVTAITYQMMSYNRERNSVRKILVMEGAEKSQIICMYILENVVVVFVSAIIGLVLALVVGKGICSIIEKSKDVVFYTLSISTIIKVGVTFIIAVVIGCIFSALENRLKKSDIKSKVVTYKIKAKKRISRKNFISQTHKRWVRNNGVVLNIFIRVFSLVMAVIMVICVVNISTALKAYKENEQKDDFVGFQKEDTNSTYNFYYIVDYKKLDELLNNENMGKSEPWQTAYQKMQELGVKMNYDEYMEKVDIGMALGVVANFALEKKIKMGNSLIFKGISQDIVNTVQNIDGVESIRHGYFETSRTLTWDDMDFEAMGAKKYAYDSNSTISKDVKYLFATEYTDIDEKLYNLISKYIGDSKLDYEAFKNGDVVVVFEDKNTSGVYDTSMKEGVTIQFNNYYNSIQKANEVGSIQSESSYTQALLQYYIDNICDKNDTDRIKEILNGGFICSDKEKEYWLKDMTISEMEEHYKNALKTLSSQEFAEQLHEFYVAGTISEEEYYNHMATNVYFQNEKVERYKYFFEPATTAKVSAVVYVNDEIKEALKEYIPEFGQYTTIASTNILKSALEHQNELLRQYLRLDTLPDEIKLDMNYNQLNIRYGLNSAISSTGNVVASYLGQAGFSYNTYSEEKDLLKSKTIETFLLYGFSLIACILVDIIVGIIVVKNRMEKYKERITILKRTGADEPKLIKIFMAECIRQSLWCIFTAVFMVVVEYFIVRKSVKSI